MCSIADVAPTPRATKPRAGASAKASLLTIMGEFVLPHGGAVWTATLVRALAALGVEERNARQAIARLAEQGLVRSEREGRRARWHVTDRGVRLLTAGAARIYGFGDAAAVWDGRWLVVVCSVPEEQRAKRHRLRSQLGFAGFGFLGPTIAVSPHVERESTANTVLEELGLLPAAVVVRGELGEHVEPAELLRRGWDLDTLAADYDAFIATFGDRSPRAGDTQFAAMVELVHEWRRFPFVDPEIPRQLLPPRWPGRPAKQLFDARHAAWSAAADEWYVLQLLDGE